MRRQIQFLTIVDTGFNSRNSLLGIFEQKQKYSKTILSNFLRHQIYYWFQKLAKPEKNVKLDQLVGRLNIHFLFEQKLQMMLL